MIIAIVKASIAEGKHSQLRKIANILQNEYAPHEPGCEQYESFIDNDTFITIECWRTQESLDEHLKTEHVAKYVPMLRECVVGGSFDVQFIESNNINFVKI